MTDPSRNAAPGPRRCQDHAQPLLLYKHCSLDSPVLLSSFGVISANLSNDVSTQPTVWSTVYPLDKYEAHGLQ